MESLVNTLSWVLMIAGSLLLIIGGSGLIRLPDFFTRLHAVSVTESLATGLIIAALMLQAGFGLVLLKLIILLILIFWTSPTATHALAKAAIHGGLRPDPSNHTGVQDRNKYE